MQHLYDVAIQVVFFLVVIVCSVTELRENRIYNLVSIPAFLAGLGLNYLAWGAAGLKLSLLGAAVGFGVYLLFYLMKGMGAGDVKLGAALGALKGFHFMFDTIVWGAILGGLLALVIVAVVTLGAVAKKIEFKMPLIPYGVTICLGAVVTFLFHLRRPPMSWINWSW